VRIKIIVAGIALLTCAVLNVRAQQPVTAQDAGAERRVSLEEQPVALDALGRGAASDEGAQRCAGRARKKRTIHHRESQPGLLHIRYRQRDFL
jgi:hypothetical protein